MGPGTLGVAHTRDEFVTVESLVTGTGAALAAVESIVCD
jgi:acetylornithine deacetylase/succinyl-diaminopimelate desuccinylase-like protein